MWKKGVIIGGFLFLVLVLFLPLLFPCISISFSPWATACSTIILGAIAILQKTIVDWWRKPILDMELDKPGTDNFTNDTHYWRRLIVTNSGGSPAEWVVVRVKDFQKYDEDRGDYIPVDGFIPTNLTWAYGRAKATQGRYLKRLPHGSMPEYCDLADATAPKEGHSFQFHLSFAIQSSECQGRGKFLLSVALQAANSNKIKEKKIEVIANKWSENVEEMRTEGFPVRFV